jgi:hypothetical protein
VARRVPAIVSPAIHTALLQPLIQRLYGDGGNTTMALVFKKRGQMCSESMGVTLAEARMSKRP